jgi:hypothetical protein
MKTGQMGTCQMGTCQMGTGRMGTALTPPKKRRIEKNIFALVLLYATFHEESEKKYEKILEIIFTLPPWP